MNPLIIGISDLHLGRRNPQDSFTPRADIVQAFARRLVDGARASNCEITLVLNGDVIDLWEIVPDEQLLRGDHGYQAITAGLLVPASNAAARANLAVAVNNAVRAALHFHPEFLDLLRAVLDSGGRVHFNIGNHDHQLHTAESQAVLMAALADNGVNPAGRITIDRYYWNEALGFYAEHGEQFASEESRSPLDRGGTFDEPSGFYFLRYVWNRLEHAYPDLLHSTILEGIAHFFKMLIDRGAGALFHRLLCDYYRAHEALGFPLVDVWYIHRTYQEYRATNDCDNAMTRASAALRREAAAAEGTPNAADLMFLSRLKGMYDVSSMGEYEALDLLPPATMDLSPLDWLPGSPVEPKAHKADRYMKGVVTRFKARADPYPQLDMRQVNTVMLGHTHETRQVRLVPRTGPQYYNVGSWTRGKHPHFAWSYADGRSVLKGMRALVG